MEPREAAKRATEPPAGPALANPKVQVLAAVLGGLATTIVTKNLGGSPAANCGGVTIFDVAADTKTFPGPIDGSTVEAGDTGPQVEELERLLADRDFNPGAIDGRFDRDTEQAVKAFQESKGIAADGVVGGQTWTALREGQ